MCVYILSCISCFRWHPQVGKAKAPDFKKIRTTIDNTNDKYHPPSARYTNPLRIFLFWFGGWVGVQKLTSPFFNPSLFQRSKDFQVLLLFNFYNVDVLRYFMTQTTYEMWRYETNFWILKVWMRQWGSNSAPWKMNKKQYRFWKNCRKCLYAYVYNNKGSRQKKTVDFEDMA